MTEKNKTKKTKIYFWLKVDKKFFDNIFIKRLKSIQGGYAMTVIYIRLMLESLADDCVLYYEGYFENLAEELALKLDVSEDDINQTLAYFTKCGLIQIDNDNNAYMAQAEAMVEQETNWASYKRGTRKIGQSPTKLENVQPMSNSCPTEKEIEKEKESKKEKEKEIEIESKQKKEIYIDNFDATTDFTKIRNIEDFLGDNYLTDLTDEDLITGFTQYYLARVPDNYELNTLKKRLKTIDRELLQQAYKQAGMNGANTLAYIVATLKNWEKLGIKDLEDWENHEKEREALTEDEMLPF
ncbi:phage replisome organizer N-terminal domain-containing protein [Streptococcus agalactiae]|uniref:phage replisome organizer N-terminal domain-containing protein n=1 Tax=Streptococcus agalactiae TaxID=1311 RepID=UPI00137505A3|nr:phage replisome organizer N-terminal domain-containing protein [Streptococcus agalactiae]KAF1247415.1 hypothetical protein B8V62_01045 [Streptococcus agalactiae]